MAKFDRIRQWLGFTRARQPALDAPVHPDVRFEESDIHGPGVVLAGITLLVVIWIIVVLLHFVFALLASYRASVSTPSLPLARQLNVEPPAPRLQTNPRIDLKDLRAYEDSQLHSYKWVDRQKGIASIPIDQAMALIAQRGIPPQKAPKDLKLSVPEAGTRRTGFEGKAEAEPR